MSLHDIPGKLRSKKTKEDKELYLILAERARVKPRIPYLSAEDYNGLEWGFSTISPVPSWYETAKEVLAHAIEHDSGQAAFGLYVNLRDRKICLYSKSLETVSREAEAIRETERRAALLLGEKRAEDRRQSNRKYSLKIGDKK